MFSRLLVLTVALLLSFSLSAEVYHFIDGDAVEGQPLDMRNGIVIFQTEDGGKMMISFDRFAEEEREKLRNLFGAGEKTSRTTTVRKPTNLPKPAPKKNERPPDYQHPGLAHHEVGQPAPELSTRLPNGGGVISLEDLRGKVILVNFWAGWEEASMREAHYLTYFQQRYGKAGVQVFGVSLDTSYPVMWAKAREAGMNWPQALDAAKNIRHRWGITAIPTTVLIDQNGTILYENIACRDLEPVLRKILGMKPLPRRDQQQDATGQAAPSK